MFADFADASGHLVKVLRVNTENMPALWYRDIPPMRRAAGFERYCCWLIWKGGKELNNRA